MKHGDPLHSENKFHGMTKSKEYSAWHHMKDRCLNPNDANYGIYGGRGIKICDKWIDSFLKFYEDMGDRPEGTSLDRIDVNGNYEPSNCRWANSVTQARNQRLRSTNTSGYKGVSFHKHQNKWISRITINKSRISLGYFETKEEAIKARKEAEIKYNFYE